MNILAVDTSTKHLSIAVAHGDKVLASRNSPPRKDLSLTITFDIERLLQKTNIFLHDIEGFAIGLGPGSFTSLRVGFSMIKAFAMVTEKPVVGISSLDALAMNVKVKKHIQVCPLVDARRGLLYAAVYDKDDHLLKRKTDYLLKPIQEILPLCQGEVVFVGDGIPHAKDAIMAYAKSENMHLVPRFESEKHWLPHARELVHLGYQRLLKGEADRIETLSPMYLYPEDCQVSRK